MEKENSNLHSQGIRTPQGAVGARDVVPVPAPSISNDGQMISYNMRGRAYSTGTLSRRKRLGVSWIVSSSDEEITDTREDDNESGKKDGNGTSPVISPVRKKGKGEEGQMTILKKRGRGRPPTTGEYVGLAAAKEMLLKKEKEEMELRAEKDLSERWERARSSRRRDRAALSEEEAPEATAKHYCGTVEDSVKAILRVATTSGKLKGTYIKILKEAATSITDAVESLRRLTVSEETKRLEDEVSRLSREVKTMREERDKERKETEERGQIATRPPPRNQKVCREVPKDNTSKDNASMDVESGGEEGWPVAQTTTISKRRRDDQQELLKSVMTQVGLMLDARFGTLDDRLLPEKRIRPPLRNQNETLESPAISEDKGKNKKSDGKKTGSLNKGPIEGRREGTRLTVEKGTREGSPPAGAERSSPTQKEEWATVARRGRKGKDQVGGKPQRANTPGGKKRTPGETAGMGRNQGPKRRKIKPPRTAAVVLTLEQPPQGDGSLELGEDSAANITLGQVLTSVKKDVSLEALGVKELRPKRAATGAMIFEVPGENSAEGANRLAERLREVLKGRGVRVDRKLKNFGLRAWMTLLPRKSC